MQEKHTTSELDVVLSVEPGGVMHVDRESLPVVPAGERLIVNEVYIDTVNRGHGPFRALPGQTASSGHGYVAEHDVEPAIWDLLVREDGEARLQHESELAEHPNDPHVSEQSMQNSPLPQHRPGGDL